MIPRPTRLYEAVTAAMDAAPEATVATLRERRTFAELRADAARRADLLDAVAPRGGSRVLIALANHPDYIATLLAVWSRTDLPILADPSLGPAEIDTLVDGCGIDAIVRAPGTEAAGTGAISVALDERQLAVATGFTGERPELAADTELGRLTSGSTRAPACIEFSAEAVTNAARTWAQASGLRPADLSLCFAGLYNGLAFNTTLMPSLFTGASLVLPGGMPSGGAIMRHVTTFRPSILVAFPAAYERLTDYTLGSLAEPTAEALRGLRLRLSSAAPLSAAVAEHVAHLSGPISDYYGIAETGPVTFADGTRPEGKGMLLPGVTVDVRPRPDGAQVLHVRTASMGTRYLNCPGEFERAIAEDGSYRTSDTGTVRDGELFLTGRAQPILNIGGRKFTVESVTDAIGAHPEVTDCRVMALTTPSGRECVGAAVQARSALEPATLRAFLRERLADYKVPEVIVVGDLPRGATGKVKAEAVRELLTTSFQQPVTGGR
ncbi:MAG TPA: class I adenylate-forming enzyme family protein [Nocardia sp.]|uniref:class I adenylate-forming enzyme family protein n=1 Tax=Nocardia TaxID=1817 RepID=UPI002458C3AE|nr:MULTISPECIES: class I adenylate-forming enzyme family protein [Nocardia]HLS75815.1 class I adenylate-forming enzyme family protein [Nocardia sp.]